jgi:hypothetical protein
MAKSEDQCHSSNFRSPDVPLNSTPQGAASSASTPQTTSAETKVDDFEGYQERLRTLAADVFKAHKQALGSAIPVARIFIYY